MAEKPSTYAQRFYESALEFFERGQYEKALEHIDKAIDKAKNHPDYYSTRGVFLHKMNDLVAAMDAYQKALQVAPNHAFSHFNLGLIFMKLNRAIEAIQEWEAVIRQNPRDVDAIFNIAVALSHLGRRKEAVPFFEKVIEIQPTHIQAHQNLGIIYRDEHFFEKAKRHLNRLKELDSTYIEIVNNEILKCEEQEFLEQVQKTDALKIAREAGLNDSEIRSSQHSEALLAAINLDFEKSLQIANKLIEADSGDIPARILRGQAFQGLGRMADAIAELLGVVAEKPDSTEAHFQLGNLFLALDDLEKALDHFERVRTHDPGFPLIDENITNIRSKIQKKAGKS